MTNKELSYVEDAVSHLQHFKKMCQNAQTKLTDKTMTSFVKDVENEINNVYNKLFGTLHC